MTHPIPRPARDNPFRSHLLRQSAAVGPFRSEFARSNQSRHTVVHRYHPSEHAARKVVPGPIFDSWARSPTMACFSLPCTMREYRSFSRVPPRDSSIALPTYDRLSLAPGCRSLAAAVGRAVSVDVLHGHHGKQNLSALTRTRRNLLSRANEGCRLATKRRVGVISFHTTTARDGLQR